MIRNRFFTLNLCKINKVRPYLAKLLLFTPFLLTLSTVFIIDNHLAHGVVSGKYFWFYGSMGLVSIAIIIHSFTNKQTFRFSLTDAFVLLFAGSVFLSSLLFGDTSANTTKLTLLALLLVLYFCLRLVLIQRIADQVRNDKTFICFFIILTGLVEALWGLLQLYGFKPSQHGLFKLTGSFFNPGPYAGYLAVAFPLALYFALRKNRFCVDFKHEVPRNWIMEVHDVFNYSKYNAVKIFSIITCIAILITLPVTMSRASWLAAIAGSIIVIAGQIPVTRYSSLVTHSTTLRVACHLHRHVLPEEKLCRRQAADLESVAFCSCQTSFGRRIGSFPGRLRRCAGRLLCIRSGFGNGRICGRKSRIRI